jgi:hypothetical protein
MTTMRSHAARGSGPVLDPATPLPNHVECGVLRPGTNAALVSPFQPLSGLRAFAPAVREILRHVELSPASQALEMNYKFMLGGKADPLDLSRGSAATFGAAHSKALKPHLPPCDSYVMIRRNVVVPIHRESTENGNDRNGLLTLC